MAGMIGAGAVSMGSVLDPTAIIIGIVWGLASRSYPIGVIGTAATMVTYWLTLIEILYIQPEWRAALTALTLQSGIHVTQAIIRKHRRQSGATGDERTN